MSHQPERSEKNCLNCGTLVAGRFCQQCGQENIVPHMHFFALVRHFIFDIFHFDGKFFDTLRQLFFKPGLVAREYVAGKRSSYLDPIKMYLFTSAVFFIFFFAFANTNNSMNQTGLNELSKAERFVLASRYSPQKTGISGTSGVQPLQILLDTNYIVIAGGDKSGFLANDSLFPVQWRDAGKLYGARKVAGEKAIVLNSKSKWLEENLNTRLKRYKDKFDGDNGAMLTDFFDKLVHRFPYLLFLSLPFFAALLTLLYRHKKGLYYFDHAVFTLYHYVFSFILLLLIIATANLKDRFGLGVFGLLTTLLVLSWPVHLIFALKRFYLQGWGRTIIKFVLLNGMGFLVLLLLFLCFLAYSIFTI